MANLPGQIIGEIGELAEKVGHEAAQAPKDILGGALESLGASAKGQKGQQATPASIKTEALAAKPTPLDEFGRAKDLKTKQAIARRALEYLAKGGRQELSVRDRLEREEAEKKHLEEKKAKESAMAPLPASSSKRKRGDLYGVSAKSSSEKSKTVRQD